MSGAQPDSESGLITRKQGDGERELVRGPVFGLATNQSIERRKRSSREM